MHKDTGASQLVTSTREKVLLALKSQGEEYVSGQELAQVLSLSRTAVWKHIKALKKDGYKIKSVPHLGYCLRSSPDLISPAELGYGQQAAFCTQIHYFRKIDSTNNKAKELAFAGAPAGTLVVAEEQTGGRGRLGREWFSPKGGIWFSILLRPQIFPSGVLKVTLLASVAGVNAIQETTSLAPKIKWPNDLVMGGKKLAGILTEMETEAGRVNFIILGMGLNANIRLTDFPHNLKATSASLWNALGRKVDRTALLRTLLIHLQYGYAQLESGNFSAIMNSWRAMSDTLGSRVKVKTAGGIIEGTASDISDQGALIVELDSGESEIIWSGDIVAT